MSDLTPIWIEMGQLIVKPYKDLQDEVRSLTQNLKSSQALEQQVSDREAILEDKLAKVNTEVCVIGLFTH